MTRLFVYGSLQPGGPNYQKLARFEGSWTPATLKGRLLEAGWGAELGYPGLVLGGEEETVRGQVFASDALALLWDELDRFEGDEYERAEAPVLLETGETVRAFVYVLKGQAHAHR